MSKPNINIPEEFAVNGIKTDFASSKIESGFSNIEPDILAGDNLNKFIDDTYKGLNGVLELYDTKINKLGDTMTGALSITLSGEDTKNLIIRNDSIERFVTPSTQNQTRIQFSDKNGDDICSIYYQQRTDGSSRLSQILRNNLGDDAYSYMEVDSSGSSSCYFPNTTCCEGRYVDTNTTIVSNASLNGSSNLSYTLNLPNDGQSYMVWIMAEANTGATSGNYISVKVGSDLMTTTTMARAVAKTASSVSAGSTACIVVSSSHKIYLSRSSSWNGTVSLYMVGYRRIGTNA